MPASSASEPDGALAGLRVLEMGQLLAGPFAGHWLAGFGAEVVKLEPPGVGDPLRRWRMMHGDTSLWFRSLARNKRSVTCDLRRDEGAALVRRMISAGVDILIENFRPGRLEAWGLGPDTLMELNPRLIVVRISGYGQTGPYRERPGFANVAEAFAGLRHLTGEPGRPPVRSGISLGDTLAGMHAAFAALTAVHERQRSGRGQVVDVALYEAVFSVLESTLPEYDRFGHVRQPTGGALPGIVPSNTYPCADERWIVIGANSDRMYRALMRLVDAPELADDPSLAQNDGRVAAAERIDAAIARWTAARPSQEVLAALRDAEIPAGPIQTIADLAHDPHVREREVMDPVALPDGTDVRMPAFLPKLGRTPGRTRWAGPALGEHTDAVLREWLGLSDAEIAHLRAQGIC